MPRPRKPSEKLRKAARLLLFRVHGRPGVKGWELRRVLGKDYLDVVKSLNEYLSFLGLEVIAVDEEGNRLSLDSGSAGLSQALFLVVLKDQLTLTEAKTSGWRIDDLAILAATLLYLTSNKGKAPRKVVLGILKGKFPSWRVEAVLDRFVRLGYLEERGESLAIGWRAKAEVDLEKLVGISKKPPEEE